MFNYYFIFFKAFFYKDILTTSHYKRFIFKDFIFFNVFKFNIKFFLKNVLDFFFLKKNVIYLIYDFKFFNSFMLYFILFFWMKQVRKFNSILMDSFYFVFFKKNFKHYFNSFIFLFFYFYKQYRFFFKKFNYLNSLKKVRFFLTNQKKQQQLKNKKIRFSFLKYNFLAKLSFFRKEHDKISNGFNKLNFFKSKTVFYYTELVNSFEHFTSSNIHSFISKNANIKLDIEQEDKSFSFSFLKDLFQFISIIYDRNLFRRSVFWAIWKNSQTFRYFLNYLLKFSFLKRLKFLAFLKGYNILYLNSKDLRDFHYVCFLWFFFLYNFIKLYNKMRINISFFYKNSFFFKKKSFFYDLKFLNKIFFSHNFNLWSSSVVYSFGRKFFFKKILLYNFGKKIYKYLVRKDFLRPFGFIKFINKVFSLSWGRKYKRSFSLMAEDVNSKSMLEGSLFLNKNLWDFVFYRKYKSFSKKVENKIKAGTNLFSRFFYKRIFFFRVKFFLILYRKFGFFIKKYINFFGSYVKKILRYICTKTNFLKEKLFNNSFSSSFFFKFFSKVLKKNQFKIFILKNITYFLKILFLKNKIKKIVHNKKLNFYFYILNNFISDIVPLNFFKRKANIKVFVASSFKSVNYDIVNFLIKKLNYDKIFKGFLQYFRLLHINKKLILKQRNRIFFFYLFLRKFLSFYWKLKFNFIFPSLHWATSFKVFEILFFSSIRLVKIFIRKTATNFIVTLTDLFGKVIYSCTSFSSLILNCFDKRRRMSVFAMIDIVHKLIPFLFFFNISHVILICRIKVRFIFYTFYKQLKIYGIKIYGSIREFKNPHNGVKKRKRQRK